mgnify:FL=1
MESTAHQDEQPESLDTTGFVIAPLAAAAALDSAAFSKVNAAEAIPATWEERARKAWEYYVEEPLVKNCVKAFQEMPHIPKTRLVSQTADIHIE